MNVKLVLEYDGTDFCGSQRQAGARTIQETLETALRVSWQIEPKLSLAGRTDSGVHARGQVANFKLELPVPISRVKESLNGHLPQDVRIISAKAVPETFHSRYSAVSKHYGYCLWLAPRLPMTARRFVHKPRTGLELTKLAQALEVFEGEHDFAAFSQTGSNEKSTVRRVDEIRLWRRRWGVLITFRGPGFLRKMVRMMVAAALDVASGKYGVEEVARRLEGKERAGYRPVAPAKGLWLLGVRYGAAERFGGG